MKRCWAAEEGIKAERPLSPPAEPIVIAVGSDDDEEGEEEEEEENPSSSPISSSRSLSPSPHSVRPIRPAPTLLTVNLLAHLKVRPSAPSWLVLNSSLPSDSPAALPLDTGRGPESPEAVSPLPELDEPEELGSDEDVASTLPPPSPPPLPPPRRSSARLSDPAARALPRSGPSLVTPESRGTLGASVQGCGGGGEANGGPQAGQARRRRPRRHLPILPRGNLVRLSFLHLSFIIVHSLNCKAKRFYFWKPNLTANS